ncbi:MAG: peroxiredoxin, partial [Deltaproteobacteria bacterium]|nr:peroxiredoxin [Deltaproteobacteria bacterium]
VQVGAQAPDFTLPSIDGTMVTLSSFQGRKNVMLTFVPAAWTPVCSDQWPGYNLVRDMFEERDAVVIGISVDNLPTLHSWVREMGGLWFSVLSDFWPHGRVASLYGVLRGDGTAERAVFVIDHRGVVRYVNVNDINTRPSLQPIMQALDDLAGQ